MPRRVSIPIGITANVKDLQRGFRDAERSVDSFVKSVQAQGAAARRGDRAVLALARTLTGIREPTQAAVANLRRVQRQLGRIDRSVRSTVRRMTSLQGAFVVLAGGGALGLAVRQSAEFARTLDDQARLLGITTDELQELRFAAQEVGLTSRQADVALQRFTRRTAEAAAGSGVLANIFRQYNIELRNADGTLRSSLAVLDDFADAVAGIGSDAEALRVGFSAFDTEGAKLVLALRQGSIGLQEFRDRARDLGLVLNADAVQNTLEFDQAMRNLGRSLTTARNALVGEFSEELTALVGRVQIAVTGVLNNTGALNAGIRATVNTILLLIGAQVVTGVARLVLAFQTASRAVGGLSAGLRAANTQAKLVAGGVDFATTLATDGARGASRATRNWTRATALARGAWTRLAAVLGPGGIVAIALAGIAVGFVLLTRRAREAAKEAATTVQNTQATANVVLGSQNEALRELNEVSKSISDGDRRRYADLIRRIEREAELLGTVTARQQLELTLQESDRRGFDTRDLVDRIQLEKELRNEVERAIIIQQARQRFQDQEQQRLIQQQQERAEAARRRAEEEARVAGITSDYREQLQLVASIQSGEARNTALQLLIDASERLASVGLPALREFVNGLRDAAAESMRVGDAVQGVEQILADERLATATPLAIEASTAALANMEDVIASVGEELMEFQDTFRASIVEGSAELVDPIEQVSNHLERSRRDWSEYGHAITDNFRSLVGEIVRGTATMTSALRSLLATLAELALNNALTRLLRATGQGAFFGIPATGTTSANVTALIPPTTNIVFSPTVNAVDAAGVDLALRNSEDRFRQIADGRILQAATSDGPFRAALRSF